MRVDVLRKSAGGWGKKPSPSPSIQPLDAWKKGWKTLWSKLGVGWEFVGGEYERIARLGHNTKGAVNSA
ncbi:hypothetical protein HZH66_012798 [Vespula vulgaris]|uniref:Uncharacterized protein n=1 Tax=Vespula vulgaris TaxID=7454 RepID=A0A834MUG5_VESVU|nr:hypothetical protein HZH66_012798 [Vespula vulgaris]